MAWLCFSVDDCKTWSSNQVRPLSSRIASSRCCFMSVIVNVHEAKTHFSRLLEQAHAGCDAPPTFLPALARD